MRRGRRRGGVDVFAVDVDGRVGPGRGAVGPARVAALEAVDLEGCVWW